MLFIPIKDVIPGNIYKTNDPDYPFAYVLKVDYIDQYSYKDKNLVEHSKTDEICVRFLCKHKSNFFDTRYKGSFEYHSESYDDLLDKRFIKLVDFKLQYDKENGFHIDIDFRNIWKLSSMCKGIIESGNKPICDPKPYKFNHDFILKSVATRDICLNDFEQNIKDSFAGDRYIQFKDVFGSVPAIEEHAIFFFVDKANFDLARLQFQKNCA